MSADTKKCPTCGRNQLYFRGAYKTFRCAKCKSSFDVNLKYIGIDDQYADKYRTDEFGNRFFTETKKSGRNIVVTTMYELEEGKTTLRTAYSKLDKGGCEFKERLSCGSGIGFERCKLLTIINNKWSCGLTINN